MTLYYIVPQGTNEIIALDATSNIQLDESGTTTNLPVESGEEISDHYINSNTKISMGGIISTLKSNSNRGNKSPEDYIKVIRDLKKSGSPFSVHFSDKANPLTNCLFENISFLQSSRNGTAGESSSYKINFTVKQIRLVKAAQVVVQRGSRSTTDAFSVKKESGAGTQEPSLTVEEQGNVLIKKGGINIPAALKLMQLGSGF